MKLLKKLLVIILVFVVFLAGRVVFGPKPIKESTKGMSPPQGMEEIEIIKNENVYFLTNKCVKNKFPKVGNLLEGYRILFIYSVENPQGELLSQRDILEGIEKRDLKIYYVSVPKHRFYGRVKLDGKVEIWGPDPRKKSVKVRIETRSTIDVLKLKKKYSLLYDTLL